MDGGRNYVNDRTLIRLLELFTHLLPLVRLHQHTLPLGHLLKNVIPRLKAILYILAIILVPPPPQIPKYDLVLLEGNFGRVNQRGRGRDCWEELVHDGPRFRMLTGETPEALNTLANDLTGQLLSRKRNTRKYRRFKLSARNRLLMIFIWLRHYPREELLAAQFGVSRNVVSMDIQYLIPVLWHYFNGSIRWPINGQWQALMGTWDFFPNAVGAIDGTQTEVNIPLSEPQHEFYSGHLHYHCISTQIIIDCDRNIRFLRSGFLGHSNDAMQYHLLPSIGHGQELELPQHAYLLADSIYPNRYPLLTPFRRNQINHDDNMELFNLEHRRCRIAVEHVISYFKTYAVMKGVYRHGRWLLPVIADICAVLAHRHIVVNRDLR